MVRIRLRRMGLKAQPSYRLVVTDKENPRDGRFLEIVGFYNPRTSPTTLSLEEARIYDWMGKGAQPTESVAQLFKSAGLDDRFTRFKKGEPVESLLEDAAKTMGGKFIPVEQGAKTRRNQMKALTEYIAKSLVENPDMVEVSQIKQGNRVRLELKVAKDDMGRVIGKNGRVANAIRVLLRVAAEREGQQVTLDVMEP